jgi:exodeoxyribonuclease VII small subunit
MIKHYEGGKFSGMLKDGSIKPGDALDVTGPYGVFTLRPSSPRRLLFIGGGAGMAPILSLLRHMQETENAREAAYYYGARTEADLFVVDELGTLPCGFVPALSEDSNGWKGESGLITDVVDRLEGDITEVDAYVCGPPPMVEATIALLEAKGVAHQPNRGTMTEAESEPVPSDDTIGYAEALAELDGILRELEGSDVDVDRLAERVARASDLIALCRGRIDAARVRIDQVIADLDATPE